MSNTVYNDFESTTEPYRVHGYVLIKRRQRKGYIYSVSVKKDSTDPLTLDSIVLWTKGRVSGKNLTTGEATSIRSPGSTTLTRSFIPAGDYQFTVEEATEFWCFAKPHNNNILPEISSAIVIPAGTSAQYTVGDKLVLVDGTYTLNGDAKKGVSTITVVSPTLEVYASTDTYGFLFA